MKHIDEYYKEWCGEHHTVNSCRFSVGDKVNYCNGLIFEIASINEKAEVCYDKCGMWYALVNCKPA